MNRRDSQALINRSLYHWRGAIGRGEEGANNRGPFIDALGDGRWVGEAWCALFSSWGPRLAWLDSGRPDISMDWAYRHPTIPEPGARALWRAIGGEGRFIYETRSIYEATQHRNHRAIWDHVLASTQPGDFILWERAGGHHIAPVTKVDPDGVFHTIEGNVGAFPAKVKRLAHDLLHEPHFLGIASLWDGKD